MNKQMGTNQTKGIERLFNAFLFSLQGLTAAYKNSVAFKQEVLVSIIIFPLSIYLGQTAIEKIFLFGSWFLVLILELINTAFEMTVDRISLDINFLSKNIKDIASAAVLMALINTFMVWGIIILIRIP